MYSVLSEFIQVGLSSVISILHGTNLSVGTCGAVSNSSVMDATEAEGWLCEICHNETTLEASLVCIVGCSLAAPLLRWLQISECVLCPRKRKEERKKPGPVPRDEMDIGFLRARKPTEGQGWVHILCSLFASEVSFTDATRLRLVEGVSAIGQSRWETVCDV